MSQVTAKSFEEAQALEGGQDKEKYLETPDTVTKERARVDQLLVPASEMKEKAKKSSMDL